MKKEAIKYTYMILQKYIPCVLLCFLIACGTSGTKNNPVSTEKKITYSFPIIIDQDKDYPNKELILNEISDISFIPLDTSKKIILQNKNLGVGVQISENDIFIKEQNYVARFSLAGELKNKIGRAGRGPGEMINLILFALNSPTKEIYLNDLNGKILVYSYNGDFKKEFKYSSAEFESSFFILSDSTILSLTEIKPYSNKAAKNDHIFSIISSKDGKVINFFGIKTSGIKNSGGGSIYRILKSGNELVLNHPDTDTIYTYYNDSLKPRYIHKYKNKRAGKSLLFESPNFAILQFTTPVMKDKSWELEKKNLYIDKLTGEVYNSKYILKNIFDEDYIIPEFYSCGKENTGIHLIPAYKLIEYYSLGKIKDINLKSIASKMTENSNPVLITLKFKDN